MWTISIIGVCWYGLGFLFLIPLYIFQIYGVFISKVLQGSSE